MIISGMGILGMGIGLSDLEGEANEYLGEEEK